MKPVAAREFAGGKILASVEDGIARLTFNQPEKHNAISLDMWQGIADALNAWADDPSVRVVVLTGSGTKAFVSGADISQFEKARGNAEAELSYREATSPGREALAGFPKPVIARIRGFCLGGGLDIALMTDFRIASSDSIFGIPAARLGVAYGFESVKRLVDVVGPARARMILYTARRLDAEEALRFGLIEAAVPPEGLDEFVNSIARQIAENAPLSIAAAKLTVGQVLTDPAERDMAAVVEAGERCFNSTDFAEGRRSFMEKRLPQFKGR